jgi:predicted protein tyrosine phosphatase
MGTLNRLATAKNPYQGKALKVLCVCSAGLLRSPTAAVVLQREFGYNTRAAGISRSFALIPVDKVLLEWADEIVVMESWMAQNLPEEYDHKKYCLDIEDNYEYMNEELQEQIITKYKELHQNESK